MVTPRAWRLVTLLGVGVALGCEGSAAARTDSAGASTPAAGAAVMAAGDSRLDAGKPLGIGRQATAAEIRAWDIDVNPAGVGLPPGRGTHARGAQVFAAQCVVCHGPKGEGFPPNPRLIGREPADFSFARDPKLPRTIGNYWPYATTLYDYVNRAMPFNAPGSLAPGDVYSLVAFLLAENGIIDTTMVIDARSLPTIRMPARDRFIVDDRQGGATFR